MKSGDRGQSDMKGNLVPGLRSCDSHLAQRYSCLIAAASLLIFPFSRSLTLAASFRRLTADWLSREICASVFRLAPISQPTMISNSLAVTVAALLPLPHNSDRSMPQI